jgi:hypothetical protein
MNLNCGLWSFGRVRTLCLVLLATIAEIPALAQQDTTPPVLTGFTFSPMAVDTTTSSATVNVTAQITDNLSGSTNPGVFFGSPSGQQAQVALLFLTSGTDLSGTWTGTVTIPAHSEAGMWTVSRVFVEDNAGNYQNYYTSDLQALGFPTTIAVDTPFAIVLSASEISTTASGLAYSRVSKTFNGTVAIKNISTSTLNGPFQIVFTVLPAGVTLANATGTFNGNPFITVPSLANLTTGQVASVNVQFNDPSNAKINFAPVIYSGSL